MRAVSADDLQEAVKRLAVEASIDLPADVESSLRKALEEERHRLGRYALEQVVRNLEVARKERLPICQDTGYFTVFLEYGPDVLLPVRLQEAVDRGVAAATQEAFLRASVVGDPLLDRRNTGNNTPTLLHLERKEEEGLLRLTVMPKGGGSENAGMLGMLLPTTTPEEIKKRVIQHVEEKAPSACPPVVVGVGLGGSADTCMLAAKLALLRKVGTPCPYPGYEALEREILEGINASGIGAGGLGGSHTALAVHLVPLPTHIANLPLAVSISCHALRRRTAEL